jgi:hypothetical protein
MKTTTNRRLAAGIGALGFLVSIAWQAAAADSLYYEQYVAPALKASQERAAHDYHNPVLYDAAGTAPLYGPIPERTVWRHSAAGVVLVAGDLPAVPLEWNDTPRYEMFRVSLAR